MLGSIHIQKQRGRFYVLLSEWYSPLNGFAVDKRSSKYSALMSCSHTPTSEDFTWEALQNAQGRDKERMHPADRPNLS